MTQDKREKTGVKTNCSSAKSKNHDQRARKKLSATLLTLLGTEDELYNIHWDSVPLDVQEWLAGSFTRNTEHKNKSEENAGIRTISHAVQAGSLGKRTLRMTTSSIGLAYPEEVIASFKNVDEWSFSVFALHEASEGQSLKFLMCELFNKYDLLSCFKIPITSLISFAIALEAGYNKYQNPFHNSVHAADVTQTVHNIMLHTGIMHWFTNLEILAIIFSSSVHDYDHNGTTNSFHVQTRSETARLYNDISVLENHHVSAAYQLMQNEEMNILANLTEKEWRELRHLVIKMVLATDMSHHSRHMSTLRDTLYSLQQKERADKAKVMSMIVHVADISHPSKPWELHHRWAEALMEEFFKQGDKEAQLGLPISSLCDRKTTNIAESQIGFIDVIVKPAFDLLLEAVEKIVAPLKREAFKSECVGQNSEENKADDEQTSEGKSLTGGSGACTERSTLITLNIPSLGVKLMQNIEENRKKWEESQQTTQEEPSGKESNDAADQVSRVNSKGGKHQKTSKCKHSSAKVKKYCITQQSPTTCDFQLSENRAFAPMDVNFIVYNVDSSKLLQTNQDSDAMEVTESYEELVDNESSWRKAAGQNVDCNIEEMRRLVPKSKPLSPNESDDVIIQEFIPDDPQHQPTSGDPAITCQDGIQQPPNIGFITTDLTQKDMEVFSLWNEEIMRRAAEQQRQGQNKIPADATLQKTIPVSHKEGCYGTEGALSGNLLASNFILQVISFDAPSVTCEIETGPSHEPCQQEVANPLVQTNDNITPANASQQNETTPCEAAAVSGTSLSYGVFKIPQ